MRFCSALPPANNSSYTFEAVASPTQPLTNASTECVCASEAYSNERNTNNITNGLCLINEEESNTPNRWINGSSTEMASGHNSKQPTIGRSLRPIVYCTNARSQLSACTNSSLSLRTLSCVYLNQLTNTIKVLASRCYTLFRFFSHSLSYFCVLCVLMCFFFILLLLY